MDGRDIDLGISFTSVSILLTAKKFHFIRHTNTHARTHKYTCACCNYGYYLCGIVRFVNSKRLVWLGHVMRMEGKRIPKRVLEWKTTGRRNRGRPRKRWIEDIEEDIQIMGIKGWRKLCKERAEWKRITEKAKTHSGL